MVIKNKRGNSLESRYFSIELKYSCLGIDKDFTISSCIDYDNLTDLKIIGRIIFLGKVTTSSIFRVKLD